MNINHTIAEKIKEYSKEYGVGIAMVVMASMDLIDGDRVSLDEHGCASRILNNVTVIVKSVNSDNIINKNDYCIVIVSDDTSHKFKEDIKIDPSYWKSSDDNSHDIEWMKNFSKSYGIDYKFLIYAITVESAYKGYKIKEFEYDIKTDLGNKRIKIPLDSTFWKVLDNINKEGLI